MFKDYTFIKSLNNGLSLYRDKDLIMVIKDMDKRPFACITLDNSLRDIVWKILWPDLYGDGGSDPYVMLYYSLEYAINEINRYWTDRITVPDANMIKELNTKLRKDVVNYFGDSVNDVTKYNNVIHDCYVHGYPVEVSLQIGTMFRFLMNLVYKVKVSEYITRTLGVIRPLIYSRNGTITMKWSIISYVPSYNINLTFDSFIAAADYMWEHAGPLVVTLVNQESDNAKLKDILDAEIALLVER